MGFLDEQRDPLLAGALLKAIHTFTAAPWTITEMCGARTHGLAARGLGDLLPSGSRLVHGPGCPICGTPPEVIDRALAVAAHPGVILTTSADMLEVPGTETGLAALRARGADVRAVPGPFDAVRLAVETPRSEVVFFATGCETTATATATAVLHAAELGLRNLTLLTGHLLALPATAAALALPSEGNTAFLAPGRVCAVTGWAGYEPLAATHRTPIVVTGAAPLELLDGVLMAVRQLASGRAEVENGYARAVGRTGNIAARELAGRVFRVTAGRSRRLGIIPDGGLALAAEYAAFDAAARFGVGDLAGAPA
ncbi:hydrogenase formation protein HypD [Spongiactinospora sp. TRM90649]|uniref:hydrogenase formation protein HypD n=1 Tax=Spongiactinospora sp. TRM90649 TaxID=3031114 RepID=UPI0023F75943|nr:hydrogenase formation protein HypD [Spongiactinospora sp. TRM90649]MDF5754281.1 hydrogenase formation protein HypD [Spongiactinospora sp. TRM90649]